MLAGPSNRRGVVLRVPQAKNQQIAGRIRVKHGETRRLVVEMLSPRDVFLSPCLTRSAREALNPAC